MGILRPAVSACSLTLLVFAAGATGVAEAAWTSSPQSVTAGPENVLSLEEAPGADGTTSLVWDDYLVSSGENTIHLARIPLGGTPSTPVQLDTGPGDALDPKLAAGADGHSSVVWTTSSGEPDYLAQVSPSGTAGAPLLLPVHGSAPAVAIDANEVTTTAWTEGDAILFERVSPAGVADPPVTLPETAPGSDWGAMAGVDRAGDVLIGWWHGDSSGQHWSLEMTRVDPAGVASSPVTLASEPAGAYIDLPTLAVNPEGDALFAWTDDTEEPETPEELENPFTARPQIYTARFELVPHGASSGVARQVPVPEGAQSFAAAPALYADGRGLLAATSWHGATESLVAVPVEGDGAAGRTVAIPTPLDRVGSLPTLQIDSTGVATLGWLEGEGESTQMLASRMPDGGAPGAPVSLAAGPGLEHLTSTIDSHGDVTLASDEPGGPIFTRQWINPPSCLDGNASTHEEVTTLITLQCAGSGAIAYVLAGAPAHGTATLNGATGVVTYTPEAGFGGVDSFTFKATSEAGESQLGTFTITVEASAPSNVRGQSSSAPRGSASPTAPRSILRLSSLRLSRTALARLAHRRRALMATFYLSGSAHVTLAITRLYGRRIGSNCRRTPYSGHRHQHRCSLSQTAVTQPLGSLGAGEHHLMIPTRTIRRLLRPGAYELTLTASDAAGRAVSGKRFIVRWQR